MPKMFRLNERQAQQSVRGDVIVDKVESKYTEEYAQENGINADIVSTVTLNSIDGEFLAKREQYEALEVELNKLSSDRKLIEAEVAEY